MTTLVELVQEKMLRREELRGELLAIEKELVDAGAILAVSVSSAGLLRRRGRFIHGDSIRAQILQIVADGTEHNTRDIQARIAHQPDSVAAQLSRMAAEGDIRRVRQGWYTCVPKDGGELVVRDVAAVQ